MFEKNGYTPNRKVKEFASKVSLFFENKNYFSFTMDKQTKILKDTDKFPEEDCVPVFQTGTQKKTYKVYTSDNTNVDTKWT